MTEAASQPAAGTDSASQTQTAAPSTQAAPSTAPVASANTTTATAATEPVYNLKAPEGFDPAGVSRVVELAKLYGIAPDKAQKLLEDTHATHSKAKADMDAALAKQKADWHAAIMADKEIGGENFKPTLERAQKVINEIDQKISPGIKQLLEESGYGDEPRVVRLFAALGRANREDTFATGGNPAPGPRPLHEVLYPKG